MVNAGKYPNRAMVLVPGQNLIGFVDRGDKGYIPLSGWTPDAADAWNARHKVGHAMRETMLVGSMFGWHVPGADPARADELYPSAEALIQQENRK